MRNIIIGTAGHIDHGKTTLIHALTGRSTDTLKEEIKRGISINLGFTYFDLPSGKRAGIIDVPGHERFIKNMLAGATGIDIVLLTVAANEGIKPQTVEHIDILSYLDIKNKIIVLTKCDLADEVLLELVIEDIKEQTRGTFFEDALIIPVDSLSKKGLDELTRTIDEYADNIQVKNENAPARLNIDRIFSQKGFGTIVTGTLVEGKIKVGDELTIYPQNMKAKIRNIQVHDSNIATAYAGQRTALNISNLKMEEIERGDVLAKPGSLEITTLLDVKITLTSHTEKELTLWDRLRIYLGAKEILARLVPLNSETIKKGESCFCQLRLEEPIVAKKDDKFVIRYYSPLETIGGGIVLDPNPKKHGKADKLTLEILKIKERGETKDIVEQFIKNNSGKYILLKNIVEYTSLEDTQIKEIINKLLDEKIIIEISKYYFHMETVTALRERILEIVSNYHNNFTLRQGIGKEELRSKLNSFFKPKELDFLLKLFEEENAIKLVAQNYISLHNFKVVYDKDKLNIKNEIENILFEKKFTPPTISELTKNNKKEYSEVLESLIHNSVIKIDSQTVIHRTHYETAKALLINFITSNSEITLAQFRDLINSSRKYAVLMLDDFDRNGITLRVEDKRILKTY